MTLFAKWLGVGARQDAAAVAYDAVVGQARRPEFFTACGVPDSVDGRFDLIVLHLFLVFHRLNPEGGESRRWLRRLFERFVDDMDRSLREMGAGDLGVGRRVKSMAYALNGRLRAYSQAFDADPEREPLRVALDNNLYGTVLAPDPAVLHRMANYVHAAAALLREQTSEMLRTGAIRFPQPPAADAAGGASAQEQEQEQRP